MKKVILIRDNHLNKEVIKINFVYDNNIKEHLKTLPIVNWSKTLKSFYIIESIENKKILYNHLRVKNLFVDYSRLKNKTFDREVPDSKISLPALSVKLGKDLEKFKRWLQQKRLSQNTVNTYFEVSTTYLRFCELKNLNPFSQKSIEIFNYEYIYKSGKSISYQNQCINGIKKYFEYHKIDILSIHIERPRKEKKLPEVLSIYEIKEILQNTGNLKHRALLSLLYSAGLRIGEALNLKISDIDSKRMLIHIKQAKGKKDRYTLLSNNFLKLLREYYIAYKPKDYLFEGRDEVKYTNSSAQAVLKKALQKSNINKKVTLHTLRHSFATHLLEKGTDIRYIQELLGHSSPKTTMIYTHVTESSIKNIKNPFDDL